jgi:hypothetical protein
VFPSSRLTSTTSETPDRHTRTHAGLLETLTKSYETLEDIQKSLEEYLESKRVSGLARGLVRQAATSWLHCA